VVKHLIAKLQPETIDGGFVQFHEEISRFRCSEREPMGKHTKLGPPI
jgi:hypothetical protein